jgi:hypothetical protein
MVRDSDTSAMKFSNGMSSPPWPSGAGEVQNGGCLGLLKLDVGGGGVIGFRTHRDGAAQAKG